MGDNYYPEYYLRKRKRDRVYSLLTRVVMVLVMAGGLGGVAGFFAWHYVLKPRKAGSGITEAMADQRQELATQQRIADAQRQPGIEPAPTSRLEFQPTQLAALPYAESMPLTSVSLLDNTGAVSDLVKNTEMSAADLLPGAEADAADAVSPGSAGDSDESSASGGAAAPAPVKVEGPIVESKKEVKAEPERKPKPDVDRVEPKQGEKAVVPPAPSSTAQVFRVYAGSSGSKDEADSMRQRLSSLGLSGSVIKSGGDYLVLVASVPEYAQAEALTSDLQGKGFQAFSTRSKSK